MVRRLRGSAFLLLIEGWTLSRTDILKTNEKHILESLRRSIPGTYDRGGRRRSGLGARYGRFGPAAA